MTFGLPDPLDEIAFQQEFVRRATASVPAVQTTLFVCPFCAETIVEQRAGAPLLDPVDVERDLREHIVGRHPVRWRLSRKFRRALSLADASRVS